MGFLLWLAWACSPVRPPPPATSPGPCDVVRAAGGRPENALADAERHLQQARINADEGEYTLADNAVACWLQGAPNDSNALLLQARIMTQQHRFAEAAAAARVLAETTGGWEAWLAVGDAELELGNNDAAAAAYQKVAELRPGILLYDRVGWLRWLEGDEVGAREMMELAVAAGSPADPEPLAWALVRLGWLNALQGAPAPQLDAALALVPNYAPALLARGKLRLFEADPEGAFVGEPADSFPPALEAGLADLRALPNHLDALLFRRDYEPVKLTMFLDRRGWADAVAAEFPAEALSVIEQELTVRHDDVSLMYQAWISAKAGRPNATELAKAALARGCPEPRVLHHAAMILFDPQLARRALGPGLTASERRELRMLAAENHEGGR